MPGRRTILATEEIYHIFNRGNARQPIFINTRDYKRFVMTLSFYRYISPPLRLSKYLILSQENRKLLEGRASDENKILIELFCFCLMPNHYHLLIKQKVDNGISKFISQIQNSYVRYLNTKKNEAGSIFQGRFKAVRVETDEQLVHLSRYIHLNPYSSFIVKSLQDLKEYPWSSIGNYLGIKSDTFIDTQLISSYVGNWEKHSDFIENQADYQRKLNVIGHLTIEKD